MRWASRLLLCLARSGLSLSAAGQQPYPNRPMVTWGKVIKAAGVKGE